MTKHDEARRAFLIGAAVGAGAVAGQGLVPDALAQTHWRKAIRGTRRPHAAAPAQPHGPDTAPSSTTTMPPRSRPSPSG